MSFCFLYCTPEPFLNVVFSVWKAFAPSPHITHPLTVTQSALTHRRLNELAHTIYWQSLISILCTSGYEIYIFLEKMAEVFANSEDSDQTPPSAASDLGLHCLPDTLLGVSRLQWVYPF